MNKRVILIVALVIFTVALYGQNAGDFTVNGTVLTKYNGKAAEVVIPAGVTSIGDDAFDSCKGLTSVTIPNSVKSIGDYAFAHCTSLTAITIPNSVTSIGGFAFTACTDLISVTFQGTISSEGIDDLAFGNEGYIGDLRDKFLAGGSGTYTRENSDSYTWTKQKK